MQPTWTLASEPPAVHAAASMVVNELTVKRRKIANVLAGEPWVYPNSVIQGPEEPCLVAVSTEDRQRIGWADWNPGSPVPARILCTGEWPGDETWLDERMTAAIDRRFRLGYQLTGGGVRLVNAEGDGLPGLIVDAFGRHLVIDLHSRGMAGRLELIEEFFTEHLPDCSRTVRLSGDTARREGVVAIEADLPELRFAENGVVYRIPAGAAQKTGFYLDQRENRRQAALWANDRRVLDLFAYHGAFGLSCLAAGSGPVLAVDSSRPALAVAQANAEANDFELEVLEANVFDCFGELGPQGQFEMIICDPPKLAPRRADRDKGLKAYRFLIDRCLDLLAPGGILMVASCSQAIGSDDLIRIIAQQGVKRAMDLDVIAVTGQPSDHPWSAAFQTGRYLSAVFVEWRF